VKVEREESRKFAAYLEAKFTIDSASLNASLFGRFRDHLQDTVNPRILDLGTGTGAMLRRIVELDLTGDIELIGLDQEEQNLAAGLNRMEQVLRHRGYDIAEKRRSSATRSICGEREGGSILVEFLRGDLLNRRTTGKLHRFDCITAHAFMDLMPLTRAVAIIRTLLKADGVFYSTLNYDGLTVLLPEYEKPGFERRLLRIYDRSMEQRRSGGRKTGGSLSGRRLYQAIIEGGFKILGMGSSDWNVFPSGGTYTDGQKLFLTAILSMIEGEARRFQVGSGAGKAAVNPKLLAAWYSDRCKAVRNHSLSLIVHQLDLMAKPN
jgi:SAM-dependent methyltransferase